MRIRLGLGVVLCAAAIAAGAAHGAPTAAIFTIAGGSGALLNGPADIIVAPDGAVIVADTISQLAGVRDQQ
jgi:hypothetical protein